ncbi:hypothetical protein ACFW15_10310, partial [Streptomyces sp. NPDC058953]
MSDGTRPGRPSDGWHVDAALAAAYARDTVREPDAWAVEKHIETCAGCATAVSAAVRATPAAATALATVRASLLAGITDRAAAPAGSGERTAPGAATASSGPPTARPSCPPAPCGRRS